MRFIHSGGIFLLFTSCAQALPPENYGITETYRMCELDKSHTSENSWSIVCERVTRITYPDRTIIIRPLPSPRVQGSIVEGSAEVLDDGRVIRTWGTEPKCQTGDPLCADDMP